MLAGLVVDAVHDTEEIVVKPVQKQVKGLSAFAGATIMGGDTVVGEGSTIGANVFLTASVPPHSLVIQEKANLKIMNKKERVPVAPDWQI